MKTELTDEQILLGELYAWLHRRAEYLRKRSQGERPNPTTVGGDDKPDWDLLPEQIINPVEFLQKRTAVKQINLKRAKIEFFPNTDFCSQVDCINHLISEAEKLEQECRQHGADDSAELCSRVIQLARQSKIHLEKSIPTGGQNDNII